MLGNWASSYGVEGEDGDCVWTLGGGMGQRSQIDRAAKQPASKPARTGHIGLGDAGASYLPGHSQGLTRNRAPSGHLTSPGTYYFLVTLLGDCSRD